VIKIQTYTALLAMEKNVCQKFDLYYAFRSLCILPQFPVVHLFAINSNRIIQTSFNAARVLRYLFT